MGAHGPFAQHMNPLLFFGQIDQLKIGGKGLEDGIGLGQIVDQRRHQLLFGLNQHLRFTTAPAFG